MILIPESLPGRRLLVVLMVFYSFNALEVFATFTPTVFVARQVPAGPTIDGLLDERFWQSAQVIDRFYRYKSGGVPAKSSGEMRVLWDRENVYLGMRMDDVNILPSREITGRGGFDGPLYEGDVIEFFVRQTVNSPQYHEFEFGPTGDQFDARFDNQRFGPPGILWNSGVQSAVTVLGTPQLDNDVDQGWIVEAAIPLDAFDPVATGTEWSFTFARYDFFKKGDASSSADLMMSTPGDPMVSMGGVTAGFHTYEIYDRLRFVAQGDFDGDGLIDADDIDLLSMAVRGPRPESRFDLTQDGVVDWNDRVDWVVTDAKTSFGNANLDGEFDSSDLVSVFIAGEYEDHTAGNSGWAEGNWDGNADFQSGDLVLAFQYSIGARLGVSNIPEPFALHLVLTCCLIVAARRFPFRGCDGRSVP